MAHLKTPRPRELQTRRWACFGCALWLCVGLGACSRTGLKVTQNAVTKVACAQGCDDKNDCTLDGCDSANNVCTHVATPRDEDKDGWDACKGDCNDHDPTIHPQAAELCDNRDNNCNGQIDEGLRSECGDCRPGCRLLYLPGKGSTWQPSLQNSSSVQVSGNDLLLSGQNQERYDAWIANDIDSKVTRLSTRDGSQLARYDSVLLDGKNHAEPLDKLCDRDKVNPQAGGNCPSRTSVNLQGAVYVANRAFDRQGTVTKIAGFEEDCIDRNHDGTIQTSQDLNGNGRIDLQVPGEYLGQADECLLWTVDVGSVGGVPRALAVAADGSVWVGLHGDQKVVKLDPDTGKVLQTLAVPGFKPYGAAMDAHGRLWLTEALSGQILSIDTKSGSVGQALSAPAPEKGCPSSYGIAVDTQDRVWMAGFTCPYAFRYDPSTQKWLSVHLPDAGVMRGIAADDAGRIYVASSYDWVTINTSSRFGYVESSAPVTRLTVFDAQDGANLRTFGTKDAPLPGGGSIGVGLDADGRAWLVNRDSSSATRVDPKTGVAAQFGVGAQPYTYSDFTGYSLRRIVAPSGFIRGVLEGCAMGPSEWERIKVDAQLPAGASIQIRARTAATADALLSATWLGPWTSSAIDALMPPGPLPENRFLEIEARLVSTDRRSSPLLHQIEVQVHCPI
ncbi:MAG TPA: MopE-related protein [Polyangiales bacterium]